MGLKAIAQELLGRMSAKSTIRDALMRNGVEIRTVQQMANDPASKLRRLKSKGITPTKCSIFGKPVAKLGSTKGLDLFEYGKGVARKAAGKRSYQTQNNKAVEAGFRSSYQAKYQCDGAFRAKEIARRRFKKFVKEGLGQRAGRFIGCSWDEFQAHIEGQWQDWMNWNNIGPIADGFWQIDHIVPCSWFDHDREDHAKLCWHFLNMRPLASMENSKRGNKPDDLIETLSALPSHEIKDGLIRFVMQLPHYQVVRVPLEEIISYQGRRDPSR
jgi:hypothetical protein